MGCTCAVAPWRTFVNGLAQVHRLDSAAPSRFLSSLSTASPILASSRNSRLNTTAQSRSLCQTRALRQDAPSPIDEPMFETTVRQASTPKSDSGEPRGRRSASPAKPSPPHRDQQNRGRYKKPGLSINEFSAQRSNKWSNPSTGVRRHNATSNESVSVNSQIRAGRKSWGPSSDGDGSEEAAPKKESWKVQKQALKEKFPEGWQPRKRLSPDALAGIRALNAQFPDTYTTEALSEKFEVSAENIRRILKSKWQPSPEEEEERQQRWHRRGIRVWERKAALGVKPPKKWRQDGVARDEGYHIRRQHAIQRRQESEEEEKERYRASRAGLFNSTGKVL